jgi:NAD(P)-dependent dehydrogenase (short-subunit alcohol dehydrogenase family)
VGLRLSARQCHQRWNDVEGERSRLIHPGDVADLIAFLASDKAGAITGAMFCIDFGVTAGC